MLPTDSIHSYFASGYTFSDLASDIHSYFANGSCECYTFLRRLTLVLPKRSVLTVP